MSIISMEMIVYYNRVIIHINRDIYQPDRVNGIGAGDLDLRIINKTRQ